MEICTVGSARGESVGAAMVDLNGHAAGNGGYGQGRPTARQALLYSETGEKEKNSWKEQKTFDMNRPSHGLRVLEINRPSADGLVGLSFRRGSHVLCATVRTIGWQHQTVRPIEGAFAR